MKLILLLSFFITLNCLTVGKVIYGTKIGTPKKRIIGTPKKRIIGTPKKRIIRTPEKGIIRTPEKGIIRTPEKVIIGTPEKGIIRTPEKGIIRTPEKVIIGTPEKGIIRTPFEINGWKFKLSNSSRFVAIGRKPVIYLYPEKPMDISVKLNLKNSIFTAIYPKFTKENTWNVYAEPNGNIIIKDKKYPYLFWETETYNHQDLSEGFIVTEENAENFLEEKLKILGLNDKEKTDFITYWLPVLLKNKISLCSFQSQKFLSNFELTVTPKPDSMIRIFLSIKKLNAPINIKEQKLESVERKGFTVIEWGGSNF